MIVDASVLVAILTAEADAGSFAARIDAVDAATHPVSIHETVLAIVRKSHRTIPEATADVREFLTKAEIGVVPIGLPEAVAALDAFRRYGKGHHPAKLNMGDCFSYACAKLRGVPLLYKGDDFAKTDLASS